MRRDKLAIDLGLPPHLLIIITVMAALTVANLHYNVPLLDAIRNELGVSTTDANLITVLTQTGYAAGLLFIVCLGDLFDARKVILVNFLVLMASLIVFATGTHIVTLWVSSVFTGLSSVAVQMYIPMASKYSTPKNKARDVGYIVSGVLIGVLWGRAGGGIYGSLVGWRWLYVTAALLMGICCLLLIVAMPPLEPDFKGTYIGLLCSLYGIVRQHPEIIVRSVRSALCFASFNALWACMAFHLAGAPFHAGSEMVGMLGLCGIATAIVAASIGRGLNRFGIRRYNFFGFFVMLIAWATLTIWGNSYAGLILGIIFADVGQQFVGLANQSSALAIDPHASNRINTIFMTIFFIGGSVGTFLAGQGWRYLGWYGVVVAGSLLVVIALLTMALKKKSET
jgi:predicted MFS family arabinose efflux permease